MSEERQESLPETAMWKAIRDDEDRIVYQCKGPCGQVFVCEDCRDRNQKACAQWSRLNGLYGGFCATNGGTLNGISK